MNFVDVSNVSTTAWLERLICRNSNSAKWKSINSIKWMWELSESSEIRYAKFSNFFFSENFAYILNEWFLVILPDWIYGGIKNLTSWLENCGNFLKNIVLYQKFWLNNRSITTFWSKAHVITTFRVLAHLSSFRTTGHSIMDLLIIIYPISCSIVHVVTTFRWTAGKLEKFVLGK